jgi:hypothetical protein
MIARHRYCESLRTALRRVPITALLGPGQCGKATLARTLAKQGGVTYLDLVPLARGRIYGVEFKWNDAPRVTPSISTAMADLALDRVWIVCPGDGSPYPLHEKVTALPLFHIEQIARAIL